MGLGGQGQDPAASTQERDTVPFVQEDGWSPGLVWMGAENVTPTRIQSPDRPVHSESLYRKRYPDQPSTDTRT